MLHSHCHAEVHSDSFGISSLLFSQPLLDF
jgi:hypothetical protein